MSALKPLHLNNSGMAFDPETGESYQLNEAATFITIQLQNGLGPEEAAKKLSEKFEIPFERAITDVLEFQVQITVMGLAS